MPTDTVTGEIFGEPEEKGTETDTVRVRVRVRVSVRISVNFWKRQSQPGGEAF